MQDTITRASNIQQSMADNPIYDSPLYDSIQEQLKPVFCLPQAQESLYTESPVCTSGSGGPSVRNRREEETARPRQSWGDCGDVGQGEAGCSKTCDDDYMQMQSIHKRD